MRITGGQWRGRRLNAPKGQDVRPASDRVRQAVFNILYSKGIVLDESINVLDLFCGTGAYGLEAQSRGAGHAIFVDTSPHYAAQNAESMASSFKIMKMNILKMPSCDRSHRAQLVFCDPPYKKDLALPALLHVAERGWIAPAARCVVETESGLDTDWPDIFTLEDRKRYGASQIDILGYKP